VSVQRSQASIKPGQTAGYVVQISAKNGSASGVTVKLTAQPSSVPATFSSGCAKGDGTASCAIASVTDKQAVSLDAGIAVAATATSVTSVKLTATATVTTAATWTPPAAAETTAVTAAPVSAPVFATPPAKGPADSASLAVLPLGPIPSLNGAASVLIGAGNAARLFPAITPSPGSGTGPSGQARAGQGDAAPVSVASPVSDATAVYTVQVATLIAVGLAIMLTVTRLAVRRRRSRPSAPRG
jgi:hypothetical protein